MNGRRDYGLSMAEHGDVRRVVRESNSEIKLWITLLVAFGVFAMISGLVVVGWAVVGLALAIGLANWR
jgi:fatty acid desaturase